MGRVVAAYVPPELTRQVTQCWPAHRDTVVSPGRGRLSPGLALHTSRKVKTPPPGQSEVNICSLCNLHCTRCNRDTLARTRFETLWQIARASDEGEGQADEIIPAQRLAGPFAGITRTRVRDTAWPRCKDCSISWIGPMGHGRFDTWRGFHLRVGRTRMASLQTTEVSGQRTRKLISSPEERSTGGLAGANHVGQLVSLVPVKAVTG